MFSVVAVMIVCAVPALYAKPSVHPLDSITVDATVASVDATAESSANSYAILAKLATGGMAELFLARTASSAGVERYVVLKRVLPQRAHDRHFIEMFLDEARLAAQLQHPNIAQVFDTGKLGDSYFFSMEYVHGETLRELAHRAQELGEAIPLGCVLTIAASAAAGLHHAHERLGLDGTPLGIVHRDVSPSNLMVSFEGNVKLVDFGVAKTTDSSVETQTGTVKGKISYLSPEQCRGRVADRRSDLFSLGIVIWELLVGDRLYKRDSDFEAMETIVHRKPVAPSQLRPEVPAELDAIVMKLLAKAPGDRYQTADELADELEHLAERHAIRMSTTALKRFMVELFGKRPEPWIELPARDTAAEVITVSAAIAGRDSTLTILDSQLMKVFDLTRTQHNARAITAPVPEAVVVAAHRTPSRVPWLVAGAAVLAAGGVFAYSSISHEEVAAAIVPSPSPSPSPSPARVEPAPVLVPVPAPVEKPSVAVVPSRPPAPARTHRAAKSDDVIAACRGSARVFAQNAPTCVLAACQAHDAPTARAWLARTSAGKRASIAAQCASAGTVLEVATSPQPQATPPAAKPCDDPMECRK
jgi:serine/threonine protein kinase